MVVWQKAIVPGDVVLCRMPKDAEQGFFKSMLAWSAYQYQTWQLISCQIRKINQVPISRATFGVYS
jgi:hypothetical protein